MSAETLATAYVIGAAVWLPLQWACLLWMMRARAPDWCEVEDAVEQLELIEQRPQWPHAFGVLLLASVLTSLTWPWWFARVARVVAGIVVDESRRAWRERGRP